MQRASNSKRADPESYLFAHLKSKHRDVFQECCGAKCVETSQHCEQGEYLDYLAEAMKHKAENGDMIEADGAVDRRTLTYLQNGMDDDAVHCYMLSLIHI